MFVVREYTFKNPQDFQSTNINWGLGGWAYVCVCVFNVVPYNEIVTLKTNSEGEIVLICKRATFYN